MKPWIHRLALVLLPALLLACGTPSEADSYRTPSKPAGFQAEPPDAPAHAVVPADTMAAVLEARLADDLPAFIQEGENLSAPVRRFYEARSYAPAWVTTTDVRAYTEVLLQSVCRADRDGLHLADYDLPALRDALRRAFQNGTASPADRVEAELRLTDLFMRYANDLLVGRVSPQRSSAEIYLKPKSPPLDSVLTVALEQASREAFTGRLRPQHPQYDRLYDLLDRYQQLADDGSWPEVPSTILPADDVLEVGDPATNLATLKARLVRSGDLDAGTVPDSAQVYTTAMAGAIAQFQARHGLAVDSLLGPATLDALNTPVSRRIEQIKLNMERWRWLPTDLGERHILVNIPAFTVYGYENGQQALKMNVVVGADYGGQQTPVMSDVMDHVIFRPFWNVPSSIAAEEIFPKAQNDPSYLRRQGFELIDGSGNVVSPGSTPLSTDHVRVRQKPGPSNALGLVKFMFPNRHAIYLHDSPAEHLFDDDKRAYSHGCIRLQDPATFGQFVLGRQQEDWPRERVAERMHNGDRLRVNLDESIPVYLMYLTTFVDDDGTVHFRNDIYGHDEALETALRRVTSSDDGQVETACQVLASL